MNFDQVVSKQFDQAVEDGNLADVERFFKIFPLLKLEDEGLEKFSNYLCQEISKSSAENLKQAMSVSPSSEWHFINFMAIFIFILNHGI